MVTRALPGAFLALAMLAASTASGQVASFSIERRDSFNQEPNGSGYYISSEFVATVETAAGPDDNVFTFSGPAPANAPQQLTRNGNTHQFITGVGSSPDDLLLEFPLGTYTFAATGGALAGASATLADTAPAFTSAPFFQNFSEYENLLPGKPVVIQVSGFTPRPGTTRNLANYALYTDDGMGGYTTVVSGTHQGSDPFSFGLPAGVTVADQFFSMSVQFVTELEIPNAGFGGATGRVIATAGNGAYFRVLVPEPGGFAPLAAGGIGLLTRLRKHATLTL